MVKDFHTVKRDLDFTIDGELFRTKGAVPAARVLDLQNAMVMMISVLRDQKLGAATSSYDMLKSAFKGILVEDSYDAFEMLLEGAADDTVPIDFSLLIEITKWLIGSGLGKDHMPPQQPSQAG